MKLHRIPFLLSGFFYACLESLGNSTRKDGMLLLFSDCELTSLRLCCHSIPLQFDSVALM